MDDQVATCEQYGRRWAWVVRPKYAAGPLLLGTVIALLLSLMVVTPEARAETNGSILWSAGKGPTAELWFRDARDGEVRSLGRVANRRDEDPAWAPSGEMAAFASNRDGRDHEIYTIHTGGVTRRLTFNDVMDSEPDFSPDGNLIVHTTRNADGRQIALMAADGSQRRLLTRQGENHTPSFSHNGRFILFLSAGEGLSTALVRMRVDGSRRRELHQPSGPIHSAAWSPDDRRIIFSAPDEDFRQSDLFELDVAEGLVRQVTDTPNFVEGQAQYSPDGRQLLFAGAAEDPADRSRIYTSDLDGSNRRVISGPSLDARNPDWQPIPAIDQAARDRVGPTVQMRGRPHAGGTHRRGQVRRFRGVVRDESALAAVRVGVKRLGRARCRHLRRSGRLTRAVSCRHRLITKRARPGVFQQRVRGQLPRGRYQVLVVARDETGNRTRLRYRFRIR